MKTALILAKCPEDNFTLEPEGVDTPCVDPLPFHTTAPTAQEVRYSMCELSKKEPLPEGFFSFSSSL